MFCGIHQHDSSISIHKPTSPFKKSAALNTQHRTHEVYTATHNVFTLHGQSNVSFKCEKDDADVDDWSIFFQPQCRTFSLKLLDTGLNFQVLSRERFKCEEKRADMCFTPWLLRFWFNIQLLSGVSSSVLKLSEEKIVLITLHQERGCKAGCTNEQILLGSVTTEGLMCRLSAFRLWY